jgi:hypothetical protein
VKRGKEKEKGKNKKFKGEAQSSEGRLLKSLQCNTNDSVGSRLGGDKKV